MGRGASCGGGSGRGREPWAAHQGERRHEERERGGKTPRPKTQSSWGRQIPARTDGVDGQRVDIPVPVLPRPARIQSLSAALRGQSTGVVLGQQWGDAGG